MNKLVFLKQSEEHDKRDTTCGTIKIKEVVVTFRIILIKDSRLEDDDKNGADSSVTEGDAVKSRTPITIYFLQDVGDESEVTTLGEQE